MSRRKGRVNKNKMQAEKYEVKEGERWREIENVREIRENL